jgi:Flp pilus assembly protein TadG
MRWPFAAFRQDRRGIAATEFAIVGPLILVMLGGFFEIGRLLQVSAQVERLASQYAVVWSDCPDATTCQTEMNELAASGSTSNVASNAASVLDSTRLTIDLYQVTVANGVVQEVLGTRSSLASDVVAAALAAFSDGQTGAIVKMTYSHQLIIFSALMQPILGASTYNFSQTVAALRS